jgi:hypothetical protein
MEKNEGEAERRWLSRSDRWLLGSQSCELDTPESIRDRRQLENNITQQWEPQP